MFGGIISRWTGWQEIQRVIREQAPQKPSTKLSSIGNEENTDSATIARNRKTNPDTLTKHLRGDLDWVTIKALEKDRTRRYATATELANDIRRHLCHEPVVAVPPSSFYRISKFMQRNRASMIVTLLIVVLLVVATMVSTVQYQHTEVARLEALAAAKEANTQRSSAADTLGFLSNMLESVSPFGELGRGATVEQLLDLTAGDIAEEFFNKLLIEATLLHTVANVYSGLGRYKTAETHFRRSLIMREKNLGQDHVLIGYTLSMG